MIIIAFSDKTSKILPRMVCRKFRHCAPIVPAAHGRMTMYQFTSPGHVSKIDLCMRDIRLLARNGWCFVYIPCDAVPNFDAHAYSCVALSKQALRLHRPLIQTPDGLYKHLNK